MSQRSDEDRAPAGLRARKRARTRAAIQREAVRLFREQGFAATTVEEIAAAAEVAPSTVFRYFPTKQDLVLSDDYDQLFLPMFHDQPPELTPVQAARRAIAEVLGAMPESELAEVRERWVLMTSEPGLWGATAGNINRGMRTIAEQVAERLGREPGDATVRANVGALYGVLLTVAFDWAADPGLDFPAAVDGALAHLAAGLPG